MLTFLFSKKIFFSSQYKNILQQMQKGDLLSKSGDKYRYHTLRTYKTAYLQLLQYEKENKIKIRTDHLSPEFSEKFIIWMQTKGYSKNTIGNTSGRIKSIIRRLYNKGLCSYNGEGFIVTKELTTAVYSTIEDIRAMLDLDLTERPGLSRMRAIYVIQCFVGVRFSDLIKIIKEPKLYIREIGNNFMIDLRTMKTGEEVFIPISTIVRDLLNCYDYDFGEKFSAQYYNLCIKEIAELSGINAEIIFTRTEGGKRIDKKVKKYDLMSSHTARRTFATNAMLSGLPENVIMKITGHKSYESFKKYVRCGALETVLPFADHDFFRINLLLPLMLPDIKQNPELCEN